MNAPERPLVGEAQPVLDWSERNQQWLVSALARLRKRLEAHTETPASSDAERADSVNVDAAPDFEPALVHCARLFALSPFERELLLLLTGLELDHGIRGAVAALNGGSFTHVSFSLALEMLTQPHWDALSPDAPLRHWRMAEPEPMMLLVRAPLRLDERILHFITGIAASDARLHGVAHRLEPAAADTTDLALAQRVAQGLTARGDPRRIVILNGGAADPSARREVALAAVGELGRPALWIAAHHLPSDPGELATIARHVDREAALTGAVPVLSVEGAGVEWIASGFASRLHGTLLWLGPANASLGALPERRRVLRFELPASDGARTRCALLARWRRIAPTVDRDDEALCAALGRAGAQFHLDSTAIEDVIERLVALPRPERIDAVWSAAREAARGGLDTLAQRIVTHADFDELVLPDAHVAVLRDIARQLQHRERVHREWGFADKHTRGLGLTALFCGESGTGKTLAAEAIANEVGLDLYRVDLAMLVSKYIGETEKNLKRLFDAAESSGAVLLFDEADALFGKRSEVKDSHDRYANIEVAYLLQRVEAYRGLAILTTNMKSALDHAFLRRIRFVVNFPFPDAAAREQIWRRQFPQRAPLGDVDFATLARLNLPGGHIHSIALNAAFKAADGTKIIDQAVLMEAARAEFAKLERSIGDSMTRSAG
jgi:hypothetical protein